MFICNLCNHQCNIDRDTTFGICKLEHNLYISHHDVVKNEEDFFNGINGCGVIWFHGCNFRCAYCLNDATSLNGYGKISYDLNGFINILDDFILNQKVSHIMFVNPTMYIDFIIDAIKILRNKYDTLPYFIYNTNAFDSTEAITSTFDYIDIYVPDLKYSNDVIANTLSGIELYCKPCIDTITHIGNNKGYNLNIKNYMATGGMVVRHLMLPGEIENTKECINQLKQINNDILIHILSNYAIRGGISMNENFQQYNRLINDMEIANIKDFIISSKYNNIFIK